MASNELEVLEPAATVANLKKSASARAMNRRNFMTALGVAGAASGAALVSGRSARSPQTVSAVGPNQQDVLNYLLNLEYLEATFYSLITQGKDLPTNLIAGSGGVSGAPSTIAAGSGVVTYTPITFTGPNAAQITDMLNEIYYDELNHVISLRNLLGSYAINRPALNIGAYAPITANNALAIARFLEDLVVTAYNGAMTSLTGSNLTYAAQILAAESFHCGAVRLACIQNPSIAPYVVAGTSVSFTGAVTAGSPTISNVYVNTTATTSLGIYPAGQLVVGQPIFGPGIPAGATIVAVPGTTNLTGITGTTTITSNIISALTKTTGIVVGQVIVGTNIPSGAIVTAITSATTITISSLATATGTAIALTFGAGTVTISTNATSTATSSATTPAIYTVISADNTMDVLPVDPGTAALAAAGPAQIPGSSPALYQGFFDTAGAATASSENPAGMAFTRTFSQAISVLISPANTVALTVGSTSGGFFPSAMNGVINTI